MKYLDEYTTRARLLPALLVVFPLGLVVMAWFPESFRDLEILWSFVVWSGGTYLIAQVARDRGKLREGELFETWGGKPTTRQLRHREFSNKPLLKKRHMQLERMTGLQAPSAREEAEDPEAADQVYEAYATYLREHTRDRGRFHILFEENCSYGFRRKVGIGLTAAVLILLGIRLLTDYPGALTAPYVVSGILTTAMLLFWILIVRCRWVRIPADAYAHQLMSSIEGL